MLISTIFLVTACATPSYNYMPDVDLFSSPPLNEETRVSVGDRMLSQGKSVKREALQLDAPISISGYTLTAGLFPKTGEDNKSRYFSYTSQPRTDGFGNSLGALHKNVLMDPPQSIEIVKKSGKICIVTVFNVHTCRQRDGVSFTKFNQTGDDSFQQTLFYNGRIDNKVNIGYREYSGDMARPAFSNEVEYDLDVSNEVSYKGARLIIHDADNSNIRYTVVQNFRGIN